MSASLNPLDSVDSISNDAGTGYTEYTSVDLHEVVVLLGRRGQRTPLHQAWRIALCEGLDQARYDMAEILREELHSCDISRFAAEMEIIGIEFCDDDGEPVTACAQVLAGAVWTIDGDQTGLDVTMTELPQASTISLLALAGHTPGAGQVAVPVTGTAHVASEHSAA